ncbi:hypothetical protein [Lactococcus petauri]|uniref:hypothetical protein n=1 Tax=Lactococcus petauri TaxID=1940789 RepID=UPI0023EE1B80|nr:hypothetical protein [Lactococcus petauri]
MNYLRIFHFENSDKGIKYNSGKIYTINGGDGTEKIIPEIKDYFEGRADEVSKSKRIHSTRFNDPRSIFIEYFERLFDNAESFDKYSQKIAHKFFVNLKNVRRKNFILVMFDTQIEYDNCLVILTMEAKGGLQLDNDDLIIIPELLPDSAAKIKKAVVVFEKESLTFKNGEEEELDDECDELPVRHAVVIDSKGTEDNITLSFVNFLDSTHIPDKPSAVAKILTEVFPKNLKPFLKEGVRTGEVRDEMRIMFSKKRASNFRDLTEELVNKFVSKEKLEDAKHDVESLSDKIFKAARRKNSAINMRFEAEVSRIPKKIFKDTQGGKNINISISESSFKYKDVFLDTDSEPSKYILKINKDAVTLTEK